MPGHRVHRIVASRCSGLDEEIASLVDKLVDLGPVHDLGRRMPRPPPLYLEIAGAEEAYRQRRRVEEARKISSEIVGDQAKCLAFYLHHALDILATKLVAAAVLGYDLKNSCKRLIPGVIIELGPITKRVGGICVPGIDKRLRRILECACRTPELLEWVREVARKAMTRPELEELATALLERVARLKSIGRKQLETLMVGVLLATLTRIKLNSPRVSKIVLKLNNFEIVIDLSDPESLRRVARAIDNSYKENKDDEEKELTPYVLGVLRSEAVRAAAIYSRLHYALALTSPARIFYDMVLSTSKRRRGIVFDMLQCYARHRNKSEVRKCAHRVGLRLKNLLEDIIKPDVLDEIIKDFVEALDYLVEALRRGGIDIAVPP